MRLDVIIRDYGEIEGISDFLKRAGIRNINLTHASGGIDPAEAARRIADACPDSDIVMYLSCKRFGKKSVDEARTAFHKTFEDAKRNGIGKFLIVSGHPRGTFDTLEALQIIQSRQLARGSDVFCAYNPYFDPARLREEQDRLRSKLARPFVKGVYVQMGMDTEKLNKGVEFIRSVRSDARLFGSVPVPSEATLNRLKLVALYGVFLPNSYLLSVESAKEMTRELMRAFKAHRIEPVVFAPHISDLNEVLPMFK
jgi:hypothetical protein